MLPCLKCFLFLFCVGSVRLEIPPLATDVTVEDSTVSPLQDFTDAKEENHEENHVVVVVKNNEVIELNDLNVKYVSENYDFVLILFYVKWCRYSVAMLPLFDQLITELFRTTEAPRKFAITKIDCETYENVCDNYSVVKYPTVKVMRHASIEKLEYRRERNVEALVKYVKEELVDPTILVENIEEATKYANDTRRIIGYLSKRRPHEEEIFRKAATHFKNLCMFILHLQDTDDPSRIHFEPDVKSPEDESAEMPLAQLNTSMTFPYVRDWANYKCVPYVREITFENAEEITEEGLPLFILFYRPDEDLELMKTFKRVITKHFADDILGRKINFVTANGPIFVHPLAHLGKSLKDLPLIAIDSLKHMFSYPYKSNEDLINLEKLRKYLADFYSEKLHLKYHGLSLDGDDDDESSSTTIPASAPGVEVKDAPPEEDGDRIIKDSDFIKLYPSDRRYTLKKPIRDEL